MLEEVLEYARNGFSVIPMIGKKPMIKFADRPPLNTDEIKAFWSKHPYANVAIKTEKFFVFDIDRHEGGANGIESFKKLNHYEWFKDTLCQLTAHGGYQYFFVKPDNWQMTQMISILPGIDIKAHNNNYVLLAPSIVDGHQYRWLNHKPIKKAPQGLINFLKEKSKKDTNAGGFTSNYSFNGKTKTTELFEEIINGFGEKGGRNNALTEFCGGLLYRNVDPIIVFKLAQIANKNTPDSLPYKELLATVNSMLKKEVRRRNDNV